MLYSAYIVIEALTEHYVFVKDDRNTNLKYYAGADAGFLKRGGAQVKDVTELVTGGV